MKKITTACVLFLSALLLVCAAPALADDTLVTWEFTKAEEVDGKLKVFGRVTNNTDKTFTHIGSRSWQYEQDGKLVKKSSKTSVKFTKPVPPGGKATLTFTLANASEVSNFTVTIHEATFVDPEDLPPPAPKQAARQASDTDLDAIKVIIMSGEPDVEFKEYGIRAALHNNTKKAMRKATVRVTQNYQSGEPYVKTSTFTFKNPVAPNSFGTVNFKVPTKGMTGTNFSLATTDAVLDQYEAPEREYGPKKGNILWSVNGVKTVKEKLEISTTILNNTSEDIVAFNTYTLSFDHDGGKYVSRRGPYQPKNPVNSQAKLNLSLPVSNAAAFKNVRNIKVSDVTYMSRPTSARPKTTPKSSSSGGGGGGGGNVTYKTKSVNVVQGALGNVHSVITVEVLNNSSTQPIVRLDSPTVTYQGFPGYGGWQSLKNTHNTQTVNIPPLGTKTLKFTFGNNMKQVKNVKFTATPRFGEAKKKSSGGTTIIIKQ